MAVMAGGGGAASPSGFDPELSKLLGGTSGGGPTVGSTNVAVGTDPYSLTPLGRPLAISLRAPSGGKVGGYDAGYVKFNTLEEAISAWYQMDDGVRENLMHKMWYYGLIDGPNNDAAASGVWAKGVEMAANYNNAGKNVTVPDMFARMTNLKAGQLDPGAPRTTTSKSFNVLDPAQAKVWIRQAFQSSMGRDPHDAEIRQLIGSLKAGFEDNPTVVEQTASADGTTQTSRVIDPGFDPQAFIANQLANDTESAAHQAAGTLYPALMQALASPV